MIFKKSFWYGAVGILLLAACLPQSSTSSLVGPGMFLARRGEEIWSSEGWKQPDRYDLLFINAKMEDQILGSVVLNYVFPAPLQMRNKTVYFVTDKSQIAAFDIDSRVQHVLPISRLEPQTFGTVTWDDKMITLKDFLVTDDAILLLDGPCISGNPCKIVEYDFSAAATQILVNLDEMVPEWGAVDSPAEISFAHSGDASRVLLLVSKDLSVRNQHPKEQVTVYSFDLNMHNLSVVASDIYVHCGFYAPCTSEENAANRRIDPFLQPITSLTCDSIRAYKVGEEVTSFEVINETFLRTFSNTILLDCFRASVD